LVDIYVWFILLAVCLRDLTFIADSYPDFIDEEKTVVNLEKIHIITTTIFDSNLHLTSTTHFHFKIDSSLRERILVTLANAMDEDQLYHLSLKIQPLSNQASFAQLPETPSASH
jgi:hypothetical protein